MKLNKNTNEWTDLGALHTASEINQQPDTWLKTVDIIKQQQEEIQNFLNRVTNNSEYEIIFTGAGTSEFIGNSLTPIFHQFNKRNVKSIPTTSIVAKPSLYFNPKVPTLLVSFGRSGNSPESLAAVEVANTVHPNIHHLVFTCNHEGKLANVKGDHYYSILLPEETNDKSFAMTSSFTSMFIAAYLALNLEDFDRNEQHVLNLIETANKTLFDYADMLETYVNIYNFDRYVALGDTSIFEIAQEASLKMLELTAGEVITIHNSPLGFRHGPKSIINDKALTLIFMDSDEYTRKYQFDLIKELSIQRNKNEIVVVDLVNNNEIEQLVNKYIVLELDNASSHLSGLVYVLIAQMLALFKSIQLNKTPDNPWPSGIVNRVVQGVIIYPYEGEDHSL